MVVDGTSFLSVHLVREMFLRNVDFGAFLFFFNWRIIAYNVVLFSATQQGGSTLRIHMPPLS